MTDNDSSNKNTKSKHKLVINRDSFFDDPFMRLDTRGHQDNHLGLIESDQDSENHLLIQQNKADEKAALNILKVSMIFYFILIAYSISMVFFYKQLFSIYAKTEGLRLDISLLEFGTVFTKKDKLQTTTESWSFDCISTSDSCGNSQCMFNMAYLNKEFDIDCASLYRFKLGGIIFMTIVGFGNLFSLMAFISIIFVQCNRFSNETVEWIIFGVKFEGIIYFAAILVYLIVTELLYVGEFKVDVQIFLTAILVVISVANYFCFRLSFYQLLRIKSRLL